MALVSLTDLPCALI